MSVLSKAQSNCPQGFVYVGNLSGTGSATQEFDKTVVLKVALSVLAVGAMPDRDQYLCGMGPRHARRGCAFPEESREKTTSRIDCGIVAAKWDCGASPDTCAKRKHYARY